MRKIFVEAFGRVAGRPCGERLSRNLNIFKMSDFCIASIFVLPLSEWTQFRMLVTYLKITLNKIGHGKYRTLRLHKREATRRKVKKRRIETRSGNKTTPNARPLRIGRNSHKSLCMLCINANICMCICIVEPSGYVCVHVLATWIVDNISAEITKHRQPLCHPIWPIRHDQPSKSMLKWNIFARLLRKFSKLAQVVCWLLREC